MYLDDIFIYGQGVTEHLRRLESDLRRFEAAGLKHKPAKCLLMKTLVTSLGHVVSAEGMASEPEYKGCGRVADAEHPEGTEVVRGPLFILQEVHQKILQACQAVVKAD